MRYRRRWMFEVIFGGFMLLHLVQGLALVLLVWWGSRAVVNAQQVPWPVAQHVCLWTACLTAVVCAVLARVAPALRKASTFVAPVCWLLMGLLL